MPCQVGWRRFSPGNEAYTVIASKSFSLRDENHGLNMEFMSYVDLHKVHKDAGALLNATELFRHSKHTFLTFFKHFAIDGRWSYGKREPLAVSDEQTLSTRGLRVRGTYSQRIEVLGMRETTPWLSLAIIFVLAMILMVLTVALQIEYPRDLMQHLVECLADVLGHGGGEQ